MSWNPVAEIRLPTADPDDAVVWAYRDHRTRVERRWTLRMLKQYADGLPTEATLAVWRICMTPGEPVDAGELGAFVLPRGTGKEQLARANVAVRQGGRQARAIPGARGMPFAKTYRNVNSGALYTADPAVARILTEQIRRTSAFAELCRIQPLLKEEPTTSE